MTRHDPERGDAIVAAIADYVAVHGYGPSVRDLCSMVGLASTSAVHHHLRKLRDEGRIDWEPEIARSMSVRPTPSDPGVCKRPGCDKPITGRQKMWCSPSCAAQAWHVKSWLRETGNRHLEARLGL